MESVHRSFAFGILLKHFNGIDWYGNLFAQHNFYTFSCGLCGVCVGWYHQFFFDVKHLFQSGCRMAKSSAKPTAKMYDRVFVKEKTSETSKLKLHGKILKRLHWISCLEHEKSTRKKERERENERSNWEALARFDKSIIKPMKFEIRFDAFLAVVYYYYYCWLTLLVANIVAKAIFV